MQGPLDVDRPAVEPRDPRSDTGELTGLGCVEDRRGAQLVGHRLLPGALGGSHGHHGLVAQVLLEDPAAGRIEHQGVRGDLAVDHGLAQAPRRVDHHPTRVTGLRVGGEQHPRGLGRHQLLHHHGDRNLVRGDTPPSPVDHGPSGPQRRPAPPHRILHRAGPVDVEVGVLLTGERRIRKVLHGRRRAHRNRRVAPRPSPSANRPYASAMACMVSAGISRAANASRMRRAAASAASGSSVRTPATAARMSAANPASATERRYASVVTQNPLGTGSPAPARRASDAPLPPTAGDRHRCRSGEDQRGVLRSHAREATLSSQRCEDNKDEGPTGHHDERR